MSHLRNAGYLLRKMKLYINLADIIYRFDKQVYLNLEEHICNFIARRHMELVQEINCRVRIPRFYFGNTEGLLGKKVIIYGAGAVGRDYYAQFCKYREIEIVAWLDLNWEKIQYGYMKIVGVDMLAKCEFDMLVIAVKEENTAREIKAKLIDLGQLEEKIIWDKPKDIFDDFVWKRHMGEKG